MAELAAHAERYVTLREVAHLNLRFPSSFGFVNELPWVPVSVTELHLTAHYFPIAIRLRDGVPSLGAILSDQYLVRAPITATGDWQGGYQPIALRSYPLRISRIDSPDPLQQLEIPSDTESLSPQDGVPITEDGGRPSQVIAAAHKLVRLLHDSQRVLAPALDHLLIADLVVPLAGGQGEARQHEADIYCVVDGARFARLGNRALASMVRQNFLTIDVAIASLFSQRMLLPRRLPQAAAAAPDVAVLARSVGPMVYGLGDFQVALDEGELFSLDDLDAVHASIGHPKSE